MKVKKRLIGLSFVLVWTTSILAQPSRLEGNSAPPSPIIVTMDTSVSGGASPIIKGITNLPDGTVLWVALMPPFPQCYGTCLGAWPAEEKEPSFAGAGRVTVKDGKFSAGPRWSAHWPQLPGKAGLRAGTYVLEIQFIHLELVESQPPDVRARIGIKGEYLRGPLMGGCCFGFGRPGRAGTFADAQRARNWIEEGAPLMGLPFYYARYVTIPQQ